MRALKQNRYKRIACIWVITTAFFIFFSILSQDVYAVGITPGRTVIDFEPNLKKNVSFTVLNNEHKDMNILLYVKESELSDVVTLYDGLVSFSADEESKSFTYTVNLPDSIEKPGTYKVDIVAMELPPDVREGGTFIGATTAVITQLIIKVPYPGKYAEIDLAVSEAEVNESVAFFVKVLNFGGEDIKKAKAMIDILGPTEEKIASIESEETEIKARKRKELIVTWKADVNPGMYHAVAVLRYDGKIARAEKNFAVGNLFIDVKEVTVKDFRLGGIAKFNILVESRWNEKIEDVYAHMFIDDKEGKTIADFKTASVDMEPFSEEVIYAYWDTEGVSEGDYDARMDLHYAGKSTQKRLRTSVRATSITTEIVGVSVGAVTMESGWLDTNKLIMILIGVLIAINVSWFLYFRRRIPKG